MTFLVMKLFIERAGVASKKINPQVKVIEKVLLCLNISPTRMLNQILLITQQITNICFYNFRAKYTKENIKGTTKQFK